MQIYLDNAATSWPKPESVLREMNRFNELIGSNPGRSGHHLSVEAGRILYDTRESLASLFGVSDPLRIAFTQNITHALNIALFGLLKSGDHVITTSMEHNSVMRPLRYLETSGVELTIVDCSPDGIPDLDMFRRAVKPNTKLITALHASNVTGTILPISDIGAIASEHGIPFCVDTAQTAGSLNIDVTEMNIDILCFTGHKGLYGPMGTGGIYIRNGLERSIKPLIFGGTGSRSEFELQPDFMPDMYESGTLNTIGIAGLNAGLKFISETGVENIHSGEIRLMKKFIDGLSDNKMVSIVRSTTHGDSMPVVSFNIDGYSPSDVSFHLDENYGILTRSGLHCAPSAHRTAGTFPDGTVRVSFGYFNSVDDVNTVISAINDLTYNKRY